MIIDVGEELSLLIGVQDFKIDDPIKNVINQ